jgi:hypothetical protein
MNQAGLHKKLSEKLIAMARNHPPSSEVPSGFEQRTLARLLRRAPTLADEWGAAIRTLWCGAGVCAAVALAMGVWTSTPSAAETDTGGQFLQDLEQTIVAATGDSPANW